MLRDYMVRYTSNYGVGEYKLAAQSKEHAIELFKKTTLRKFAIVEIASIESFDTLVDKLNEEHNEEGFAFCTNEEKQELINLAIDEGKVCLLPEKWIYELKF